MAYTFKDLQSRRFSRQSITESNNNIWQVATNAFFGEIIIPPATGDIKAQFNIGDSIKKSVNGQVNIENSIRKLLKGQINIDGIIKTIWVAG